MSTEHLTYEQGYENGESSVHADIICFLDEHLGLDVEDRYTEPLLALKAERDRYREAIEIALPALEGFLQGESGLPFVPPYRAARTAAEALTAAFREG